MPTPAPHNGATGHYAPLPTQPTVPRRRGSVAVEASPQLLSSVEVDTSTLPEPAASQQQGQGVGDDASLSLHLDKLERSIASPYPVPEDRPATVRTGPAAAAAAAATSVRAPSRPHDRDDGAQRLTSAAHVHSTKARAAEDDDYWVQPPPPDEDGDPVWVDLRLNVFKVSAVDTVAGTAFARIGTVFYWNDPRLVGWPEGKALPPCLWGPRMNLVNALGDVEEASQSFKLVDSSTGRLERGRTYTGTVDNPMDLQAFPFDTDSIEFTFRTLSHWATLDGGQHDSQAKGRTYRLRQIREKDEGQWLGVGWRGQIAEWALHGVSTWIHEYPVSGKPGQEVTEVSINVHVSRKAAYYFWKALLPLYLLSALSLSTFQFETDNLSDRTSTVSTYFLAAFAMLYVVGGALPKTDFLTKIDQVIVLSTLSLACTGLASALIAQVHAQHGEEMAGRLNRLVVLGLAGLHVFANLVIFTPAWWRQRRAVARLSARGAGRCGGMAPPPMVKEGPEYKALADLLGERTPE
jgi:hypothetical protein